MSLIKTPDNTGVQGQNKDLGREPTEDEHQEQMGKYYQNRIKTRLTGSEHDVPPGSRRGVDTQNGGGKNPLGD
jgi:hypothetical protein